MDQKKLNQQINNQKQPSNLKPEFFDFNNAENVTRVQVLFETGKIQNTVDDYKEQLRELFAINNPTRVYTKEFEQEFSEYTANIEKLKPLLFHGKWVYFPWLATLVHLLEDEDFQKVRTARNRNLITEDEQKIFYNSTIGIGGLSVGNSVILAIVLQGGGKRLRLADFDTLALTNLNRIRSGVENLGLKKVEMTARQIYALNPYSEIEIFSEGLSPENIGEFFSGPPKLDIVIDELDNLAVKYLIRQQAQKNKTPLVMGADNGDNAVVDIERYDLDSNTTFFHGRIGDETYESLSKLDKFGIGKTITKHIGPENVTERMQDSLMQMGKTIVSWPQLGGAALLNGSAIAYCVRKILNKQELETNRAIMSLDEKLIPEYNSTKNQNKRKQISDTFKQLFGL